MARLRYVPLTILVVCVIAATVIGRVERGDAAGDKPRVAAAARVPTLPSVCAPPVDQGLTSEPWSDDDREEASEARFTAAMAKEAPGHVTGRDGWLFFSDVQAMDISQAVGRERLSKTPIEKWNTYLSQMRRDAEARGGRFYVLIAPAKWDVYPENLPTWAQELRGTNSLDRLMAAHPELPFIDVRQPLRDASRDVPTYSPLNSHWTDYGGWVAWKAVTACLRADDKSDASLDAPAIDGVGRVDDLNEFAADGVALPAEPQRTTPEYVAPHPSTSAKDVKTGADVQLAADDSVDMVQLPVETRTADAQTSKTLLALRDSTGSALSPLWSASFARTVQYQHPIGGIGAPVDMARLVDEYRPDITIFSMTERYLTFDPPATSSEQ